MNCIQCDSDRILEISGKCSDMCGLNFKGVDYDGDVPNDLGIGGGDYIEVDICLACGMVQGLSDHPDPEFYTDNDQVVWCSECEGTGINPHDQATCKCCGGERVEDNRTTG